MKKFLWIIFLVALIGVVVWLFTNNTDKTEDYTAQRLSTNINGSIGENSNFELQNESKNSDEREEELSSFLTRLPKDTKARESNINLACNTINGTVVKSGDTFSLWDIIGNPTKEKGYKKAKTYTPDKKVRKAYGGGLCQISTTIYNAVLEAEGQEVVERHEHSRDVAYIEDGKDAAVSYNTGDFKFKNNLEDDIKIEAKLEDNQVKIRLLRIY